MILTMTAAQLMALVLIIFGKAQHRKFHPQRTVPLRDAAAQRQHAQIDSIGTHIHGRTRAIAATQRRTMRVAGAQRTCQPQIYEID